MSQFTKNHCAVSRVGIPELAWTLKRIAGRAEHGRDEPPREVVQIDEPPDRAHSRRAKGFDLTPQLVELRRVQPDGMAPVCLEVLVGIEVLGEDVDALELAVQEASHRSRGGDDAAGGLGDVVGEGVQEVPADALGSDTHVVVENQTPDRVRVRALEGNARRQLLGAIRAPEEQAEALAR